MYNCSFSHIIIYNHIYLFVVIDIVYIYYYVNIFFIRKCVPVKFMKKSLPGSFSSTDCAVFYQYNSTFAACMNFVIKISHLKNKQNKIGVPMDIFQPVEYLASVTQFFLNSISPSLSRSSPHSSTTSNCFTTQLPSLSGKLYMFPHNSNVLFLILSNNLTRIVHKNLIFSTCILFLPIAFRVFASRLYRTVGTRISPNIPTFASHPVPSFSKLPLKGVSHWPMIRGLRNIRPR